MKRAAAPAKTPKLAARVPLMGIVSIQVIGTFRLWMKPRLRRTQDLRLDGGGKGEARNPRGDSDPAVTKWPLV